MKTLLWFMCAALFAIVQLPARAGSAPIRHLVYKFTYGAETTQTSHDSGIGQSADAGMSTVTSGTGVNDNKAHTSDEGTITVDVTQEGADGGLVVNVRETAKNERSASPALCALYGRTLSVVCDSSLKVNEEELMLLRIMGRDFVGPLDPQKHWRIGQSTPDFVETNDFTISHTDGRVMTIDELRVGHLHGAGGYDSSIVGTILYDAKLTIPNSVREEETKRQNQGQDYLTIRTDTTLQLESDSLAEAKP